MATRQGVDEADLLVKLVIRRERIAVAKGKFAGFSAVRGLDGEHGRRESC